MHFFILSKYFHVPSKNYSRLYRSMRALRNDSNEFLHWLLYPAPRLRRPLRFLDAQSYNRCLWILISLCIFTLTGDSPCILLLWTMKAMAIGEWEREKKYQIESFTVTFCVMYNTRIGWCYNNGFFKKAQFNYWICSKKIHTFKNWELPVEKH